MSHDSHLGESAESPQPAGRIARHRWFPRVVIAAAVLGTTAFALTDATRDYKVSVAMATFAIAAILSLVWFALYSGHSQRRRKWAVLTPLIFCALLAALVEIPPRFDGDMRLVGFNWRWAPRPDEMLPALSATNRIDAWRTTVYDFPRFLGADGRAVVNNITLETDWQAHPPEQQWLRDIGAGWSGFAVVGDYAFTQEQRGEEELVVCYRVATGDVVWSHAEAARFDGGNVQGGLGGVGPRATPTVHAGKVFAHGATGVFVCLDAVNGARLWSHDTLAENDGTNVVWGKAGSPLVVDDKVVLSVGAPNGRSLVAYNIETGELAFSGGDRQSSYASPVLTTLAGVRQILVINEDFLTSHRADDGSLLWEFPWNGKSNANPANSQPVPVGQDRVFLSKGYGHGSALLQVTKTDDGFAATPLWEPAIRAVMKTKMSNVVVFESHVYGLDGGILECIELESGARRWKRGRYGHGQIILVGDTILVLSESGDIALVRATSERYEELGRVAAIEGITWNNPALAGPFLLVRNATQAACFRLATIPNPHAASDGRAASLLGGQ